MFFAKFAQIDFKRLILGSEGLMKNFDRKWNYLEFERSQNFNFLGWKTKK